MLAFRITGRFEKEFRLAVRRGKDVSKLQAVMRALVQEVPLDPRLRDHALKGEFAGRRECHVEPDWLLMYKLDPGVVIFERTGTHADLFE
jgi:mRNA interferase YafQ